ncbi:molybdopterin molybdotransferase MoeA [Corynebacterium tapiri]|uniref:Molybdopterin molybdenumtransferase n=1 Tax=Corynebacterium tapiri TaxID=1448266 RepID=A0A5C4U493_9CORY|nr:molybdopterin molybdotransferase MoeA [Corynebacterium tapiri]TNL97400.1 molybdopterin molybdotransferase MoeA [Corynebacterium tapiri]
MRSIEEHRQVIRAELSPRETERVRLEAARGRVLARDISAEWDSPRFANSQMDGYAVAHPAAGARVVGPTIAAGADPAQLYPDGVGDLAAPIMTGAALPVGAQCIIPVEKAQPARFLGEGEEVVLPESSVGAFVRAQGNDIAAGELLLRAGTALTPAGVAAIASQSIAQVEVYQRARLLVVTGGAEISSSAEHPAQIPDANGPMIAAAAERYCMEVAGHVRTNDNPDVLRADLQSAVDALCPDVIVTSGGISAGAFEVVRQVLDGPHAWFGHVGMQPGGPQGIARFAGCPVICLPGNPVSTLVSFRLFVAPLLGRTPAERSAHVVADQRGLEGKDQLLRGRLDYAGAQVSVSVVGGAGSHLITQAVDADCLLRVPRQAELKAGDLVTVYPL